MAPPGNEKGQSAQEVLQALLRLAPAEKLLTMLHGVKSEETLQNAKTPYQEKYWHDPVAWARDCVVWRLGQGLTPYQEEILGQLPLKHRVCVRGPHGLGKSCLMSLSILWFTTTRDGFDWKLVTTASNNRQLKEFLWPEVRKWARRLRWNRIGRKAFSEKNELLTQELRLRTGAAFAATVNDPAAIEGAHAEHMMYVFDEAKAIADNVFDAAEGAFTSGEGTEAFALCASTPGEPMGRFWAIQTNEGGRYGDWWVRAVPKEEVVAAGRMTEIWADQRALQWGPQSFVFRNRVLGEFAAQGKDGVIPATWVEAAQERWQERESAPLVGAVTLGVDVADEEGSDKTVVVVRVGNRLVEVNAWRHQDTMATVARVVEISAGWKPARIIVDGIGLGSGVVSRLRELGLPVFNFIASGGAGDLTAAGGIRFANLRAAAWWSLRERLHPQLGLGLELHPHDQVLPDLTAPTWKMPTDRILIESKDDIRKRLQRQREDGGSTDVGDALVMAFWDGADSNYEEAYAAHSAASLQKEVPPATPDRVAEAQAQWERDNLWPPENAEGEWSGDVILWSEEEMLPRW